MADTLIPDADAAGRIRSFLRTYAGGRDLQDTDDIFTAVPVTSLLAVELVVFLEQQFRISLDEKDLRRNNFRTIETIVALLARKGGTPL